MYWEIPLKVTAKKKREVGRCVTFLANNRTPRGKTQLALCLLAGCRALLQEEFFDASPIVHYAQGATL